jgi:hypothetical protein
VRLAMVGINFQFPVFICWGPRHVKRLGKSWSRNNQKAARASYREALPPFMRCAKAERVCLLGSIAVTFGTLGKLFDRRGLYENLRFEVSRSTTVSGSLAFVFLLAKSQTSHYLVVSLDVCALQIIQQTATLRDHLEQAAPRVVVFFVYFEVLGKLVDPLAE